MRLVGFSIRIGYWNLTVPSQPVIVAFLVNSFSRVINILFTKPYAGPNWEDIGPWSFSTNSLRSVRTVKTSTRSDSLGTAFVLGFQGIYLNPALSSHVGTSKKA